MTIIHDILERYYTGLQQWSVPRDVVALGAVTKALQSYGYVVITKSQYEELSARPAHESPKEITNGGL